MDDRTLLTARDLQEVTAAVDALGGDELPLILKQERALRELVMDYFKRIAGALVLCDAPRPLIRDVITQTERVVAISVTALHRAYRGILDDIIPEEEPGRDEEDAGDSDAASPAEEPDTSDDGDADATEGTR